MRIAYVLMITLVLSGCGEGTEATEVSQACAENDLIEQCPPNTTPDLSADATSSCDTSGSVDISMGEMTTSGSGVVERACVGTGACRVVCRFDSPCQHGVQSVSPTQGIICAPPPAGCGNGTCDAGENPTDCPIDCGGDCTAGQTRCVAGGLSTCTPRLRWDDPIECSPGQTCVTTDGVAACGASDS